MISDRSCAITIASKRRSKNSRQWITPEPYL
jgi:hypothetical protein